MMPNRVSFQREFGNGGFVWAVHYDATTPYVFSTDEPWVRKHMATFDFNWEGMWETDNT